MNTLYKTLFISTLGLSVASVNIAAQTAAKDTTLNRQVSLEREYTPTIQDASKINTLPALHEPAKKQYDIKFENSIPNTSITSHPIGDTGSGDIKTNIPFSKHRGYFLFGAGMYSNLDGAAGYRIVDSENDQFDLFATHNSTDGKIKYLNPSSCLDEAKAKNMENLIKAKYSHKFESLTWHLNGSFFNNTFNYYGNPYVFSNILGENASFHEGLMKHNQGVNVIEAETGITSTEHSDAMYYSANVKYNNFTSKYGYDTNYDGLSGSIFDAMVNIAAPVQTDHKAGVEGGIFFQSFSNIDFLPLLDTDPFHNLTVFKARPYYSIDGGDFKLSLGVNINWASDIENKFVAAPSIKTSWNFNEKSLLYFNVGGGINDNNFVEMNRENRYINPTSRVFISQTLYDAQIGVRSGIVSGLEFDIFGGYKYTKDDHLFVPYDAASWGNVSDMLYANLGEGHFGGALKTKLIPYTDLSLKATTHFYNLSKYTLTDNAPDKKEAWGLPSLTFDFNADFSFIDNLTLSVNYIFEGGRKTYVNEASAKMDNINELNIKGTYNILDWLSFFVRANNVMNQKYERQYGYTNQGINALGGISLKF